MRVLIAGRNAKVLATVAGTFARDLKIKIASSKAVCLAALEIHEFDLVIACEKLTDGSGLEVLSHVAMTSPNSLRIFAARPSTLKVLKGELGLFGLFRTLPYPIDMRRLWAAIRLAGECIGGDEPAGAASATRTQEKNSRVVGGAAGGRERVQAPTAGGAPQSRTAGPRAPAAGGAPQSRTAGPRAPAAGGAPQSRAAGPRAPAAGGASQSRAAGPRAPAAGGASRLRATGPRAPGAAAPRSHAVAGPSQSRGTAAHPATASVVAPRTRGASSPHTAGTTPPGTFEVTFNESPAEVAAAPRRAPSSPQGQKHPPAMSTEPRPTGPRMQPAEGGASRSPGAKSLQPASQQRIPPSDAFKRALAKRNAAKLDAGDILGDAQAQPLWPATATQSRSRASTSRNARREPSVPNESLAQLAQLSTVRRPTYVMRDPGGGSKRKVVFVGTGVFAALAAGVLTFSILSANNSMPRSPVPLPASIQQRILPEKVFPWQPPQRTASATAAQQVVPGAVGSPEEGDVPSETFTPEAEHPGPPQPNPPPPPSEPPSSDDEQ